MKTNKNIKLRKSINMKTKINKSLKYVLKGGNNISNIGLTTCKPKYAFDNFDFNIITVNFNKIDFSGHNIGIKADVMNNLVLFLIFILQKSHHL